MALIKTDWSHELGQVKATVDKVVDTKLSPLIQSSITQASNELSSVVALASDKLDTNIKELSKEIHIQREATKQDIETLVNHTSEKINDSIRQAGNEMSKVVEQASNRLDDNIKTLSQEIHNQRRMTKEDVEELIRYARTQIDQLVDLKVALIKTEASALLEEQKEKLKRELEDAAIKSKKTMFTNLALSIGAAVLMAAIGLIYKKISIGELDVFVLFRILLISISMGTGVYALLLKIRQWQALNEVKKNAATIALSYLGIIRPNGSMGLFLISLALLLAWITLTFYVH